MLGDQATVPVCGVTVRLSPDDSRTPDYACQVTSAPDDEARMPR
jgi:hypothetical protein